MQVCHGSTAIVETKYDCVTASDSQVQAYSTISSIGTTKSVFDDADPGMGITLQYLGQCDSEQRRQPVMNEASAREAIISIDRWQILHSFSVWLIPLSAHGGEIVLYFDYASHRRQ